MESIDYLAIISVAFFGSLGHCSGMCGGFVVAYTANKIPHDIPALTKNIYHLLYNGGRILSYTAIGGVSGFLGSTITINNTTKGALFIAIGILMLLIGHAMLGRSRFLQKLESVTPFQKNIFVALKNVLAGKNRNNFFLLGILNGFLPCGFVYFFAFSAASSASILQGSLIMLVFGLSTLPVMLALANATGIVQKFNLRNYAAKIAGWIVILYAYWMAYKGYLFIITPQAACH